MYLIVSDTGVHQVKELTPNLLSRECDGVVEIFTWKDDKFIQIDAYDEEEHTTSEVPRL